MSKPVEPLAGSGVLHKPLEDMKTDPVPAINEPKPTRADKDQAARLHGYPLEHADNCGHCLGVSYTLAKTREEVSAAERERCAGFAHTITLLPKGETLGDGDDGLRRDGLISAAEIIESEIRALPPPGDDALENVRREAVSVYRGLLINFLSSHAGDNCSTCQQASALLKEGE